MKRIPLLISALVLIAISCQSEYKTHESGLQYTLSPAPSDTSRPRTGDGVELFLKFGTRDSVLYSGPFRTILQPPTHLGGSVEDAIALLSPGQTIKCLINADSFYLKTAREQRPKGVQPKSEMLFEIKLFNIITPDEMAEKETAALKQRQQDELMLLDDYIKRNALENNKISSGLYFIEELAGKGQKATVGMKATVHYTGSFLDGSIFDSSVLREEPFSFVIGNQMVIEGWEQAILRMRVGGKAKIIVASDLAYGDEGFPPDATDNAQVVAPYTTLVFTIELLSLQKNRP